MKKIIYNLFIIAILVFTPFFASAQEVRDIVFPIKDGWDYNFSDTYGAARSGGRRHLGTDIMTNQMTPLVAVVDGKVNYIVERDKGWGLAIYIEDSEGYSYRYLHLNNDTPGTDDGKEIRAYAFPNNIKRGIEVKAGQVIAFAGDSGNAESTGHHLHFETWTPSGRVINSYSSFMVAIGKSVMTEEFSSVIGGAYHFMKDLEVGSEGDDVKALQIYLNQKGFYVSSSGPGSPGNESTYFGLATQGALSKLQRAKGIFPTSGFFGVITRTYINEQGVLVGDNNSLVKAGELVKDKLSPRVYYVSTNLELMWIISETSANSNFGNNWYLNIKEFDDLNDLELPYGDYVL